MSWFDDDIEDNVTTTDSSKPTAETVPSFLELRETARPTAAPPMTVAGLRHRLTALDVELRQVDHRFPRASPDREMELLLLQHRYQLATLYSQTQSTCRDLHLVWQRQIAGAINPDLVREAETAATSRNEAQLIRLKSATREATAHVQALREAAHLILTDPTHESHTSVAVSRQTTVEGKIHVAVCAIENAMTTRSAKMVETAAAKIRGMSSDASGQFWMSREAVREADRHERHQMLAATRSESAQALLNSVAKLRVRRDARLDATRQELERTAKRMNDRVEAWYTGFTARTIELLSEVEKSHAVRSGDAINRKEMLYRRMAADDTEIFAAESNRCIQRHTSHLQHIAKLHDVAAGPLRAPLEQSSPSPRVTLFPACGLDLQSQIPSIPDHSAIHVERRAGRSSQPGQGAWSGLFVNDVWHRSVTSSLDAHAELTITLEKLIATAEATPHDKSAELALDHLTLAAVRWGTELRSLFGSVAVKDPDEEVLEIATRLPVSYQVSHAIVDAGEPHGGKDQNDMAAVSTLLTTAADELCTAVRNVIATSDVVATDLASLTVEQCKIAEDVGSLETRRAALNRIANDTAREKQDCDAFLRKKIDELHRAMGERDRACLSASSSGYSRPPAAASISSSVLNSTSSAVPRSQDSLQSARVAFSQYSADASNS